MEQKHHEKVRKAGYCIRQMNHEFKARLFKEGSAEGLDEVTLMHAWVLGYLKKNEDRDIFQKTMEQELGMCRSAVTNLVQMLEKKGYIIRESVPEDARLKRIRLTKAGEDTAFCVWDTLEHIESTMLHDIDEKELVIFFKVSDQICKNLKNGLKCE